MISEQVFKFCESQLNEMYKKGGEQKFGYCQQTVLDTLVGQPREVDRNFL